MVNTPLETRKNATFAAPGLRPSQGSRLDPAIFAPAAKGVDPTSAADQRLEAAARQLVGGTFFGTLLKQMHNSPFKSDLFSGGRGEQAFSPLYDQHLIERMSRGAANRLVTPIVKKLKKAAANAYQKQADKTKEQRFVDAYRRA
jgi:Rod binding domain-containing protein